MNRVGKGLVLRSKAVFRKGTFKCLKSDVNRMMFGASVAKCRRMLASPSCCNRVMAVACPLMKGCKVGLRSVRSGGSRMGKFVIERGDGSPGGFEYRVSLSACLGRGGIVKLRNVSAETLAGVLEGGKAVGNVVALRGTSLRSMGSGLRTFAGARTMEAMAEGRVRRVGNRNTGITIVSFKIGRGVLESFIGESYSVAMFPTAAGPRRVLKVGPSLVFLSGKPKSPRSLRSIVRGVGRLVKGGPVMKVYLKRRLLTLALNKGASGLGFKRENKGRPIGSLRRGGVFVASRGRNCCMSRVPRGVRMARVGLGSGAMRKVERGRLPVCDIRCRPRTYPKPGSGSCVFSGFLRLM